MSPQSTTSVRLISTLAELSEMKLIYIKDNQLCEHQLFTIQLVAIR